MPNQVVIDSYKLEYRIQRFSTKLSHVLYKTAVTDRRCRFYDLSRVKPEQRKARSPILQFYSSVDNIGNYMPVLGIREMLSQTPDTWCVHDPNIDFDFINKHYKCVIIGGAGLLVIGARKQFERFWNSFRQGCKLPTIIWGVGADRVNDISTEYRQIVAEVGRRCDLINVRDEMTAETFSLKDPNITACPTVVYLKQFGQNPAVAASQDRATFVHYLPQLYEDAEARKIRSVIRQRSPEAKITTNYQYAFRGLTDVIQNWYVGSDVVVTTMLHGAITAYGLGIPYIAVTKTDKISAFQRKFGNGLSVKTASEVDEILTSKSVPKELKPQAIEPILDFGTQAQAWVKSVC